MKLFQLHPVAGHNDPVKGQSRFRAIPVDEVLDREFIGARDSGEARLLRTADLACSKSGKRKTAFGEWRRDFFIFAGSISVPGFFAGGIRWRNPVQGDGDGVLREESISAPFGLDQCTSGAYSDRGNPPVSCGASKDLTPSRLCPATNLLDAIETSRENCDLRESACKA